MNIWCSFQILKEVLRHVPGSMRLVLDGQHLHIVLMITEKRFDLSLSFGFFFLVCFGFVGLNRSLCKSILKLFLFCCFSLFVWVGFV